MNLNQITVPVTDVERSIGFYTTLGLKLIVKALPHYARFQCADGDATFSLHQTDTLPVGDGVWIYFEDKDIDQKTKELQAKGLIFEALPTDQAWLWREARLKDPDGNQIILYYAGENRLNPPWRINEE